MKANARCIKCGHKEFIQGCLTFERSESILTNHLDFPSPSEDSKSGFKIGFIGSCKKCGYYGNMKTVFGKLQKELCQVMNGLTFAVEMAESVKSCPCDRCTQMREMMEKIDEDMTDGDQLPPAGGFDL